MPQVQPPLLVQQSSTPSLERSTPASPALDAYRREMVSLVGVDGKRHEMCRWQAETNLRQYPEAYAQIEPVTEGRGNLRAPPAPRKDETFRQLRAMKRDDSARFAPLSAGSDPTVGDPFAK